SFTFTPAVQKTRAVTYELSKKDGLWRIDGPVTLPHVFGEDVVAVLTRGIERVRPERRKKLEAVIQHIRRASETP
ncbi:MAG TPA: hypothetical protein VLB09_05480, partial [Nitrospiria bacterium]|nr:hypothetical protein [Nitrospiria bacterium]